MIKINRCLTKEDFLQMEAMEKKFYASDFITPAQEAYAYYVRYPLSTITAMQDSAIVGFINMFPVKDAVFKSLINGTYNDSMLTVDDIQSIDDMKENNFHMFLSCIVVDTDFQKQHIAKDLLLAAISNYSHVQNKCDYIVTDNITESGCRFSQKLGLTLQCKSNHNSHIYALAYSEFINSVLTTV